MPNEPMNGTPEGGNQINQNTGYSAEYVKQLREEAASWRTKLRETETQFSEFKTTVEKQQVSSTVKTELDKRQIKVNPDWIQIKDGQTPEKAVDSFLKDYPQFTTTSNQLIPNAPRNSRGNLPLTPERQNSNQQGTQLTDYQATKKDPVARAKLRETYRSLLSQSNNTGLSI